MKTNHVLATALLMLCVTYTNARSLQQQSSSATAVSVSGGQGPFGNCGFTSTSGNAQAFASGPPCSQTIIPAPPPSTTCPTTQQTIAWGLPAKTAPLTICPGSTINVGWNTGKASEVYGLYQIGSGTCPAANDPATKLIISPASSPNAEGLVRITLNAPGTYYFTDLSNCAKGLLQQVTVSGTPAANGSGTGNNVQVASG